MANIKSFPQQNMDFPFEEGQHIHRQTDLHGRFGGNPQSGISPCAKFPFIFLFTSPSGEEFGYRDGWLSVDKYEITGEGQNGDMVMKRGNRAVRDHLNDDRELHLFNKISPGEYEYIGRFVYETHEIIQSHDVENRLRKVIQFILRKI